MNETWTEAIGWTSALVLLFTISAQVLKQWREKRTEGVSRWLFIGQIAASAGFTSYSLLLENWVFVATNAFILVEAIFGQWLLARNRGRSPTAAQ